jgi:hypothetical protein
VEARIESTFSFNRQLVLMKERLVTLLQNSFGKPGRKNMKLRTKNAVVSATVMFVFLFSPSYGFVSRSPIVLSTFFSSTRHHVATTTVITPHSSADVVSSNINTPNQLQRQQEDSASAIVSNGISSSAAVSHESTQFKHDELDTTIVEFPPPLSTLDRMKRAATFWSTTIPIVANYYGLIGNIKLQELLGNKMTDEDVEVSELKHTHLLAFNILAGGGECRSIIKYMTSH